MDIQIVKPAERPGFLAEVSQLYADGYRQPDDPAVETRGGCHRHYSPTCLQAMEILGTQFWFAALDKYGETLGVAQSFVGSFLLSSIL